MHLYTVRDECKALLESQASPELVEEVAKFTGLDGVLRAALAPPRGFIPTHRNSESGDRTISRNRGCAGVQSALNDIF